MYGPWPVTGAMPTVQGTRLVAPRGWLELANADVSMEWSDLYTTTEHGWSLMVAHGGVKVQAAAGSRVEIEALYAECCAALGIVP